MMDQATLALHRAIIRHLKGIITAWEEWLKAKERQTPAARMGAEER